MKHLKFSTDNRLFQQLSIALIMIVAIAMRFYNFADWSLSNDELSALNRLQFDSFSEMIEEGVKLNDFHPAGVQAFLWFWTHLFGNSVWVVRLPFVICGILSVWFTWIIGKRWFGSATGLFAAASMAFLQYPILYSQLARPYAPGLLFSMVTVWYWTKVLFAKNKRFSDYAGFAVFAALTAYTHHYSFLFVIIVGLSGFLFIKKSAIRNFLLASLAAGLFYLPHLGIFLHQFGIGGVGGEEGWLGKPEPDWLPGYLWQAANESIILATIFGISFLFSIYKLITNPNRFRFLALLWFVVMFLIGYFYSIWRNPILQYSILLFAFPFLLLFVFSSINQIKYKSTYLLVLILLLTGSVQTTVFYRFYERQHFGEFKGIAEKFAEWNKKYGEQNVSNAVVVNAPFYIHYYLDELDPKIKFLQYDNRGEEDLKALSRMVDSVQTPYFIYGWTKPAPMEIPLMLRGKFPCMLEQVTFDELSQVTLFGKLPKDSCIQISKPEFVIRQRFDDEQAEKKWPYFLDYINYQSAPYSLRMDSISEFAPGFKGRIGDINGGNLNRLEIEVRIYSQEEIKNALIVLTLSNDGEEYVWQPGQLQNFSIPGKWKSGFLSHYFREIKSDDDILHVYFWNPGKSAFLIDNVEIRFYND